MSALRIASPGQPTRLIPVDDGCTPRRIGPYYLQGGTAVTASPAGKKPRTPEQVVAVAARNRAYNETHRAKRAECQRRYRKKGVPG